MSSKHRLSPQKKLLFSLATCTAFFLVLEVVLRACGVQAVGMTDDPYVAIAAKTPLFAASNNRDGAEMVTAANKLVYFNEQRFLEDKPPKTYRIFCLGGSTTYGRPYNHDTAYARWLAEMLNTADPSRSWEVINVGGISYASYRIAALMEELNGYAPDLYIIHTGHNEFLERRTYPAAADTEPRLTALTNVFAHTRIYSFARQQLRRWQGPEPRRPIPQDILPDDVDAILDETAGPEAFVRDDRLWQQTLKHFEFNLRRMNHLAQEAGADVLFITPACNLRDFSPFKSEHRGDLTAAQLKQWETWGERARGLAKAGQSAAALNALDQALALDNRFADLHFQRGKQLDALGEFAEAYHAYQRATDEDVCPLRAPSAFPNAVRQVAQETGRPLIDFERLVQTWSNEGLPGNNLFLDHVHPTIDVHRRLANTMFQHLVDSGIVTLHSSWSTDAIDGIAQQIEGSVDAVQRGKALRNVAQVLAWAGKVSEAKLLSLQAVQLAPQDAHTHFIAGHLLLRAGEWEQAAASLRTAIALEQNHVLARLDLAKIYLQRDEPEEARTVIEEVLQLDPDNRQGHALWERLARN